MSVVGLGLIAGAAMLVRLALKEIRPGRPEEARPQGRRSPVIPAAALSLGLPDRIRRAGREADLGPRSLLVAKALAAATGLCVGSMAAPVFPSRVGPLLLVAFLVLGFLLPDISLERSARRRHRRMMGSLPDALDLLAVSAASGRSLSAGLLELGTGGRGPLRRELGVTGEEMAWGSGQAAALESLKRRVGGPEIASLCATLERSRRLGSPLADQLRRQASTLRQDQRRTIAERAARAAPKIQLVIALVLVPSVLLLMVAALIANGDALLGIGFATVVLA